MGQLIRLGGSTRHDSHTKTEPKNDFNSNFLIPIPSESGQSFVMSYSQHKSKRKHLSQFS